MSSPSSEVEGLVEVVLVQRAGPWRAAGTTFSIDRDLAVGLLAAQQHRGAELRIVIWISPVVRPRRAACLRCATSRAPRAPDPRSGTSLRKSTASRAERGDRRGHQEDRLERAGDGLGASPAGPGRSTVPASEAARRRSRRTGRRRPSRRAPGRGWPRRWRADVASGRRRSGSRPPGPARPSRTRAPKTTRNSVAGRAARSRRPCCDSSKQRRPPSAPRPATGKRLVAPGPRDAAGPESAVLPAAGEHQREQQDTGALWRWRRVTSCRYSGTKTIAAKNAQRGQERAPRRRRRRRGRGTAAAAGSARARGARWATNATSSSDGRAGERRGSRSNPSRTAAPPQVVTSRTEVRPAASSAAPRVVDPWPPLRGRQGSAAADHRQREGADRQVHVEDPAPATGGRRTGRRAAARRRWRPRRPSGCSPGSGRGRAGR